MEQTRPKTRTELQQQRKHHLRTLSSNFIENFYSTHPHLFESSVPINPPVPPLASTYIPKPHVKTKTELDLLRKTEFIQENEENIKLRSRSNNHPNHSSQNFNFFNQTLKVKRSEKVKQEAAKIYQDRFNQIRSGVHGEELPKFSEHLKDYWKMKQGYIENPVVKGQEKEKRPISEFCRLRTKSSSVDGQITAKPGEVNPFPSYTPKEIYNAGMRTSSRSRFSEEMLMTSRGNSFISIGIGFNENRTKKKKNRPSTAQCQGSKDRRIIRSKGFL